MEYECDDGNLRDGDGCSSLCYVEPNYRCYGGSSTSSSQCVYHGVPLSLALSSINKVDGLNQGIFRFDVYPPLFTISEMHLNQHVSLFCNATEAVSAISYLNGVL